VVVPVVDVVLVVVVGRCAMDVVDAVACLDMPTGSTGGRRASNNASAAAPPAGSQALASAGQGPPLASAGPAPTDSVLGRGGAAGRDGKAPKEIKLCQAILLAIIPWYVFVTVSIAFALAYHQHKGATWALLILAALVFISLVNIFRAEKWLFFTSALCLVALGTAAAVGLFTYSEFLGKYWDSRDSHAYANVLPSEDAAGYADAGKLVFAEEARLDVSRALGYKDVNVYCVAPILDDAPAKEVQFWAVGVDCCEQRGFFDCDDAWDSDAKSGVVVSPLRHWHTQYALAVQQAEHTFELASAPEPVFVRWVVDPDRLTRNYFRFGMGILIVATVAHGVASCVVAYALQVEPSKKKAKRSMSTLFA